MITQSVREIIRRQVSEKVSFRDIDNESLGIALPLAFGDGDFCEFVMRKDGETRWELSDDGFVVSLGMMQNVDLLSKPHIKHFEDLAKFYGATTDDGVLKLSATSDELGDAIFTFSQACLEVARAIDMKPDRASKKSSFRSRFVHIVKKAVPSDLMIKNWYDSEEDEKGVYKADFLIRSHKKEAEEGLLLFGISKSERVWRSVATLQHLKITKRNRGFKSVMVYSDRIEQTSPFFAAMTECATVVLNLDRQKKEFVDYITEYGSGT